MLVRRFFDFRSPDSELYWFGDLITEEGEDTRIRVMVIRKDGREIQICRADMESPPYPFGDILPYYPDGLQRFQENQEED